MSLEVLALVLIGAFLHASWNAMVRSGPDKLVDTLVVTLGAAALAVVGLPLVGLPAWECWPYLAASVVVHLGYLALVAAAYEAGGMAHAYPLMRGTAPLIVALGSAWLLGEVLGTGEWLGIVLICTGVLGLGLLRDRTHADGSRRVTWLALANAGIIATYTVLDGHGVRLSGNAGAYVLLSSLLEVLPFGLYVVWRRGLAPVMAQVRRRWLVGLGGGCAIVGSYTLALWAMTQAPIAMVAALRETSILFGLAIASLLLKERLGPVRISAALTIAAGAMALRLA
ncbi:EamA family transporter [Zavarzinia sp. CC-PAN008]|uniref:EamA family transporter n=1 Tax=Zavarzinia sp. CC-PAN008 TaxID=3243332 RepID=UPI003F74940C